jgi:hypothetical protein
MDLLRRPPVAASAVGLGVAMLAVVTSCRAGAAPPASRPSPIAWQTMGPGADRATLAAGDGTTKIQLFRFSFARYQAEVVVGPGSPPGAETAAALRRRRGAIAAVNGGFFDERRAPLGLRIVGGVTRVPLRRHADWGVLLIEGAGARIVHTRELRPDTAARGAIQVGPRIVVDGTPLTLKPQRARRTAVALERDGRSLTLVVVDAPIDANDLAARLAAGGFDAALMLDGGPSTQLALELGDVHVDIPGGYPVPDLLAIVPGPPPPGPKP